MTTVKVQDLLEAGVHFGHQTRKWNPKMKKFVYGERNGIYIIDLAQTMRQIYEACNFLQRIAANGGNILFVGTKRQAQEVIKEAAEKTNMFYVTERWLGGTLTNNATIQKSIRKMKEMDEILASPEKSASMKKKELVNLSRNCGKLHKNLDGIARMKKLPDALFVVDVRTEEIAVREASKLKIPIVAIVDTNGSVDNIAYPIVANDDAVRSIKIITDVIAEAVKDASEIYKIKAAEEKTQEESQEAEGGGSNEKKSKAPASRRRAQSKTDEAKSARGGRTASPRKPREKKEPTAAPQEAASPVTPKRESKPKAKAGSNPTAKTAGSAQTKEEKKGEGKNV